MQESELTYNVLVAYCTTYISFLPLFRYTSNHLVTGISYSDNAELTREATDVFIWCLTQNAESYKQWVSSLVHFTLYCSSEQESCA
jgi:hypothetical protein